MVNLQKAYNMNPAVSAKVDPWTILEIATINGAQAMGLADKTGSLKVGKEADMVLVNKGVLSLAPNIPGENEVAILPNSATIRSVAYVISDGKVVVTRGRLAEGNEAALSARLTQIVTAVLQRTEQGKNWTESLSANGLNRYASIRKADTVRLQIRYTGPGVATVRVAFSGDPFGGTAGAMLGAETVARFPADNPPLFFSKDYEIPSGRVLVINKSPGNYVYQIRGPGIADERTGRAEQILLLNVRDHAEE